MDIQIYKIVYNLGIEDLCHENSREREMRLSGLRVDFYLNKFIESSIYIPTEKELTIDEIKEKIKETYRGEIK